MGGVVGSAIGGAVGSVIGGVVGSAIGDVVGSATGGCEGGGVGRLGGMTTGALVSYDVQLVQQVQTTTLQSTAKVCSPLLQTCSGIKPKIEFSIRSTYWRLLNWVMLPGMFPVS